MGLLLITLLFGTPEFLDGFPWLSGIFRFGDFDGDTGPIKIAIIFESLKNLRFVLTVNLKEGKFPKDIYFTYLNIPGTGLLVYQSHEPGSIQFILFSKVDEKAGISLLRFSFPFIFFSRSVVLLSISAILLRFSAVSLSSSADSFRFSAIPV